jgi:transposase
VARTSVARRCSARTSATRCGDPGRADGGRTGSRAPDHLLGVSTANVAGTESAQRAVKPTRRARRVQPHLHARLQQNPGVGNATLREYLAGLRRQASTPAPPPVPSARRRTSWIMRPDEKLDDTDRLGLKTACAACPDLAALTELAHWCNELVRTLGPARLEEWINRAAASPFPEVRGFAKGLYGDFDAVEAGLTLQWSSGRGRGQRDQNQDDQWQMYGRAKLELLRKRTLAPL